MRCVKYIIILCLVVSLTGCGSQKLVCSSSEVNDDIIMSNEVTATFKEEALSEIKIKFTFAPDTEEMTEYWSVMDALIQASYIDYYDYESDGFSIEETSYETRYEVTMTIKIGEYSEDLDEILNILVLLKDKVGYDEVQVTLEENGYTCK